MHFINLLNSVSKLAFGSNCCKCAEGWGDDGVFRLTILLFDVPFPTTFTFTKTTVLAETMPGQLQTWRYNVYALQGRSVEARRK